MAATEIYFKTEYTDDQDLEIEGVKHKNSGNTEHIHYRLRYLFSELPFASSFCFLSLQTRISTHSLAHFLLTNITTFIYNIK